MIKPLFRAGRLSLSSGPTLSMQMGRFAEDFCRESITIKKSIGDKDLWPAMTLCRGRADAPPCFPP